jgi:hypothetical protein
MPESLTKLDALSEMMALSSYGNTKNLLITAIEATGSVDEQAMRLALQRATEAYPHFVSRIKEVREWGKHYLVWDRNRTEMPLRIMDIPGATSSDPGMGSFIQRITPILDRDWDLFHEPPAELHVVRRSKDRYVLSPVIHHVAADAGTASEFGRTVLAHYHQIVTGEQPGWSCEQHAISGARKRRVQPSEPNMRDFLKEFREAITHVFERPELPVGSGTRTDWRQHHTKRALTAQETERIGKLCAAKGVSLVDLLVAGTNLAIDEWNRERNVAPGILTTSMSVNMKGRFQEFENANNSALMFFRSGPEERKDLAAYAKTIALTRIKFFRRHMDFKFVRNVSRMTTSLRRVPFPMRRRIVNFLMNRHQFSVAVTLLGVVWPETKNGKPTGDTCLTHSGGITINEVHGVGYKLLSNTPLLLIVYVFRNQLNLVLHASGSLFTKEEANAFMDVTMKNVTEYAHEMPVSRAAGRSGR